ncbi:MAG: phosphoribosylanthranilate isomerase [Nitrospirae bacterium]|nr:phosphoribosylanthranilate isomerase [Nitrospirota bacterium]MCL5421319.1 phosphoribosylanthranilate isomerase [Nitrospirota bacterium]
MVKVKICGITNLGDALVAAEFGADALGFVFFKGSPRYIPPDEAGKIILDLPPFITAVGVFVDEKPEEVERIMKHAAIDVAQFHGHEPPEACSIGRSVIKAIRIKELTDLDSLKHYHVSAFLLDTYTPESFGGTGQIFNWDIAVDAKQFGKIVLAGGLNPDNIEKAVRWVRPYAVDVSSGVEEEKGKKDHKKLKLFIERAKSVL